MTPPTIDPDKVMDLLQDILGEDVRGLETLRPGAWSRAFAFETAAEAYVARFSNHPDDFDRDAFAASYCSETLPVPRVTYRGEIDGVHYAISERARGMFLDDLHGPGFNEVLPSLTRMLDALRLANTRHTTGYGGWDSAGNGVHASWREHLRSSIEDRRGQRGGSWRARLEFSPTGPERFDRDAALLLRRLDDVPDVRHVIHGDLLNYNVFVEDTRISGVIDWGCAMYGDFLYDLAWFAFWWPWYPQWHNTDVVQAVKAHFTGVGADLVSFEERMLVYGVQIGLTHQAYHAHTGDWAMLEAVTRRTTTIADEIR